MSEVSFQNVGARYGARQVIAGVSLEIPAGQVVCLVGASGGGKTTLLRLAHGTARATEGSVRVAGRALGKLSRRALREHRRATAFVDQGLHVLPTMSVHRNVMVGRLPSWPWHRVLASAFVALEREAVRELLGEVGLAERQFDPAGRLSGGQQQRIAVARLLASEAALWLVDEPTSALDPELGAALCGLLVSRARQRNATCLIATHRLGELRGLVDRVVGVADGHLAFDRGATEVTAADLARVYAT